MDPRGDPAGAADPSPRAVHLRRALALVAATVSYNVVEAVIALWSGARADSIALLGFGLDSILETAAALLVAWRLRVEARGATSPDVERTEAAVHRFVGATFLLLAIYVAGQAAWTLWQRTPPRSSPVGIALAVASLAVMPLLAGAKLRVARRLGSAALRAEARETLACSYLSLTLLLGLGANAAGGWWWADPVAALLMVPWLGKEAAEGLRGECREE